MPDISSPLRAEPARLSLSKRLSLALLLTLAALYIFTGLQAERINWTTLLVSSLSLLAFLPGLLRQRARSYDWLCFVLLLHFTVGVTNAMSPQAAWNDYLQTALSVGLFICAMMASRWLKAFQAGL